MKGDLAKVSRASKVVRQFLLQLTFEVRQVPAGEAFELHAVLNQ